jgi:hypothetical protein
MPKYPSSNSFEMRIEKIAAVDKKGNFLSYQFISLFKSKHRKIEREIKKTF